MSAKVHLVHQSFRDYVLCLASALENHVELSVTSISSGATKRTVLPLLQGARTVQLRRFRNPRSPIDAWQAVGAVNRVEADVVHWQAAGNPWVDLAFRVRRRRSPLVLTIHDMEPHPGDGNVIPGTFAVIRSLARMADRVIVHAESVRRQAIARGIDPTKIVVIPHGELGSVYLPPSQLPLAPSTGTGVLFFGRVHDYKGLPDLITAMSSVRRHVTEATLTIAGTGASDFDDEQQDWLMVEDGHIQDDRVVSLFSDAAVIVLPYREASQSGVAALAAGLGRAVVATRVGGLTEVVADGVSGLLVEPCNETELAEAITRLLTDQNQRHQLERGAYERAQNQLSWDSIALRTLGVYESITKA